MAVLIPVDGPAKEIIGENKDQTLSLEQLQKACGGLVQYVRCDPKYTDGHDHFYCHDEGKIKGLPVNAVATLMGTLTAVDDLIVGDVLFCKATPDGGSK